MTEVALSTRILDEIARRGSMGESALHRHFPGRPWLGSLLELQSQGLVRFDDDLRWRLASVPAPSGAGPAVSSLEGGDAVSAAAEAHGGAPADSPSPSPCSPRGGAAASGDGLPECCAFRRDLRAALHCTSGATDAGMLEVVRALVEGEGYRAPDDDPPILSARAGRQFGRLCVHGTRIPVAILVSMHRGGDTVEALAKEYDLTVEQVQAAIDCAEELADQDGDTKPANPLPAARSLVRYLRSKASNHDAVNTDVVEAVAELLGVEL